MEEYLNFENEIGPIVKKCPICRCDIEIEENPGAIDNNNNNNSNNSND